MLNSSLTILLFSTALLSFLFGSWVLLNSPKARLNRFFFLLCLAVSGWIFVIGWAELLFSRGASRGALSVGFGYFFGSLIPYLFYLTCKVFPEETTKRNVLDVSVFVACVVSIVLGFSGNIVKYLYIGDHATYYQFEKGWGFPYFALYMLGLVGLSAREMITKYRNTCSRFRRVQLLYFASGMGLSFVVGFVCNAFAPLFGISTLSPYSAVIPIFTLGILAFAITRHKLFDLRLSLRWTALVGTWIALLGVLVAVSAFLSSLGFLKSSFNGKFILLGTFFVWAAVLYMLCRSAEREFHRIGGRRAYAYRDTEERFEDLLSGLISCGDVAEGLVEYLFNAHDFGNIIVWRRDMAGPFRPIAYRRFPELEGLYRAYLSRIDLEQYEGRVLNFAVSKVEEQVARPPADLRVAVVIVLGSTARSGIALTISDGKSHLGITDGEMGRLQIFASYAGSALKAALQFEEIAEIISSVDTTKGLSVSSKAELRPCAEGNISSMRSEALELRDLLEAAVHNVSNQLSAVVTTLQRSIKIEKDVILEDIKSALAQLRALGSFVACDSLQEDATCCDVGEVVENILGQYSHIIGAKEIAVINTVSVCLIVDQRLLRHILVNVIENAIKYVGDKEAPEILIASRRLATNIIISVKDNGIGIPSRELSKVIRPLQRGSRQIVGGHRVDGSGMGLSIVDRLLRRMGGSVEVSSRTGQGTEVSLFFPLVIAVPVNLSHPAP